MIVAAKNEALQKVKAGNMTLACNGPVLKEAVFVDMGGFGDKSLGSLPRTKDNNFGSSVDSASTFVSDHLHCISCNHVSKIPGHQQ